MGFKLCFYEILGLDATSTVTSFMTVPALWGIPQEQTSFDVVLLPARHMNGSTTYIHDQHEQQAVTAKAQLPFSVSHAAASVLQNFKAREAKENCVYFLSSVSLFFCWLLSAEYNLSIRLDIIEFLKSSQLRVNLPKLPLLWGSVSMLRLKKKLK